MKKRRVSAKKARALLGDVTTTCLMCGQVYPSKQFYCPRCDYSDGQEYSDGPWADGWLSRSMALNVVSVVPSSDGLLQVTLEREKLEAVVGETDYLLRAHIQSKLWHELSKFVGELITPQVMSKVQSAANQVVMDELVKNKLVCGVRNETN